MKRVEGVVYLYCCEKWHERWNDKLMTRWMPRHLFLTDNAKNCEDRCFPEGARG